MALSLPKASYYNNIAMASLEGDLARLEKDVVELIIISVLRCCIA